MKNYSDKELVEMLKDHDEGIRQKAMEIIFLKYRGQLQGYFIKKVTNFEESRDLVLDTVLALVAQISKGRYRGESSIKNYLYGIANNCCKRFYARKKKHADIKAELRYLIDLENNEDEQKFQDSDYVKKMMTMIGERCQDILIKWSRSYSYEEMGFKSVEAARSSKYKCMKKLKEKINALNK